MFEDSLIEIDFFFFSFAKMLELQLCSFGCFPDSEGFIKECVSIENAFVVFFLVF